MNIELSWELWYLDKSSQRLLGIDKIVRYAQDIQQFTLFYKDFQLVNYLKHCAVSRK